MITCLSVKSIKSWSIKSGASCKAASHRIHAILLLILSCLIMITISCSREYLVWGWFLLQFRSLTEAVHRQ